MPYRTPETEAWCRLMAGSFRRFTGFDLAIGPDLAQTMWQAPQAIVSHGNEADPTFRYANARALKLWEMDWGAFTRLPSRLSAETSNDIQADRDAHLKEATEKGFVDGLSGVRISATGRRFEIRNTVLWNVVDEAGVRHGQAAFIRDWRYL